METFPPQAARHSPNNDPHWNSSPQLGGAKKWRNLCIELLDTVRLDTFSVCLSGKKRRNVNKSNGQSILALVRCPIPSGQNSPSRYGFKGYISWETLGACSPFLTILIEQISFEKSTGWIQTKATLCRVAIDSLSNWNLSKSSSSDCKSWISFKANLCYLPVSNFRHFHHNSGHEWSSKWW